MSFTSDVKEELSRVDPTCSHCDKATLAALVRMEGTLFLSGPDQCRIEIDTDSAPVGRVIIKMLHGLYDLRTDLVVRRSVLHKSPNYLIQVPSQPRLIDSLKDMGVISQDGGLTLGIDSELVKKQCCEAAYLRGAFLGSGFISNPKSDFHFEIKSAGEELAQDLVKLMNGRGINAKMLQRRNTFVVYLKSGDAILEFLALTEAHKSALELEKERVVKSVRGDVNRMINAEMANEQKATKAALEQLFIIKKVLKTHKFESLPKALQQFIRLRIENPEASLKELGECANPPLSKSAINHRLRRLESMLDK